MSKNTSNYNFGNEFTLAPHYVTQKKKKSEKATGPSRLLKKKKEWQHRS